MNHTVTATSRVAALLDGDPAALARAISEVERGSDAGRAILAEIRPRLGRARVVGVTGVPGAGKSTLISRYVSVLRGAGRRVGVVAVDPSSPFSGGAVLGDRIRMAEHAGDEGVFVRSLASRGQAGGLAPTADQVVNLMDASGWDRIVVETVGAGQGEIGVAGAADVRVVVCAPDLGDDVQALKAGILEIADVLVVNKADLTGADRTASQLESMLALRSEAARDVSVCKTTAITGAGVEAFAEIVETRLASAAARHAGESRRGPATSDANRRVMDLAARDAFLRLLGMQCLEAGPGMAVVRMTVGERHINFNGTCHGGVLFSLADTAFGLASNSHGRLAAAVDAHIGFTAPVHAGDTLVAKARELKRGNRIGTYRVDVCRDGETVAAFTGTVYISPREHL